MDAVIALHYVKMLINNGTFYELAFKLGWLSKLEEKNNYSCPKFLSYFVRLKFKSVSIFNIIFSYRMRWFC